MTTEKKTKKKSISKSTNLTETLRRIKLCVEGMRSDAADAISAAESVELAIEDILEDLKRADRMVRAEPEISEGDKLLEEVREDLHDIVSKIITHTDI